jgi:glyoxylase-like metal-dependent hydrolase (beta-lactamase superfamily II)
MRKTSHIFLSILGSGLVLCVAFGFHYYAYDGELPKTTTYVIDMEEIRRLAAAPTSDLPLHVTFAKISDNTFPAVILVAGDGFDDAVISRYSFQIVYPSGHVVLETGMTREQSTYFEGGNFYAAAFERAMTAMETADLIIATHEHLDHIGALTVHPKLREIADKVLITREQLDWAEKLQGATFPDWFVADYEPLEFDDLYRAAPGLVLIKSAGHTPGSLMAFVAFADGTEALFVGDIVHAMANVTREIARPRFMSDFIIGEDRPALLDQIRALVDLQASEPALRFVVSHDGAQIEAYRADGWIRPLVDAGKEAERHE